MSSKKNTRVALNGGGWFDIATAKIYEESRRFDGQNMISCATGSQWEHEELYVTRMGRYVMHSWSQWQGSRPTYETIAEDLAHRWLIRHGHESAVPQRVIAASEV